MPSESRFLAVSGALALLLVGANVARRTNDGGTSAHDAPVPVTLTPDIARELCRDETPSARYLLIEFGDYECPPCRATHLVLQKMRRDFPDLRLSFRHFPLTTIHPNARRAALFAEAAREQGKFEAMHDWLFSKSGRVTEADLARFLRENASDSERFHLFLQTRSAEAVRRDVRLAEILGVNSTPTLFLRLPDRSIEKVSLARLASRLR